MPRWSTWSSRTDRYWLAAAGPAVAQGRQHRGSPYATRVFNIGQVTAVRGAFALAGYDGPLRTLAVDDPTERLLIVDQDDVVRLDVRTTVPFE